ncbi:hypothetical protein L484_010369 [Morus notabilis]|uniref:Uncharacterized protein n=1 Tax=Morus notabilis TaxID=981085 RepID=W9SD13_9ROSA|nr:hypothetical protein L484_010369 [Morus notabilis]
MQNIGVPSHVELVALLSQNDGPQALTLHPTAQDHRLWHSNGTAMEHPDWSVLALASKARVGLNSSAFIYFFQLRQKREKINR